MSLQLSLIPEESPRAPVSNPAPIQAPSVPREHEEAMRSPFPGFERALVNLYRAMAEYADAHRARYEQPLSGDYYIGDEWQRLGLGLIGLLNGETGRLDCGTLDGQVRALIKGGGSAESTAEARKVVAPKIEPRARTSKRPRAPEPETIGTRKLTDRQRELVSLVRVEDNFAVYTLDEFIPDWAELKKVMLALGGKWQSRGKRKKGGFRFSEDVDATEAVRLALESGEILDQRAAEFFETPAVLANELAAFIDPQPGEVILEPSAGKGALADAIHRRCPDACVHCIEAFGPNRDFLTGNGHPVIAEEFLSFPQTGSSAEYSAIIMNPPFSGRADIHHINHALDLLTSGGRLAAIASAGVLYRDDKLARDFRARIIEHNGGTITTNPDGSFAESGTMVRTVTVKVRRGG